MIIVLIKTGKHKGDEKQLLDISSDKQAKSYARKLRRG